MLVEEQEMIERIENKLERLFSYQEYRDYLLLTTDEFIEKICLSGFFICG